MAGVTGGHKLKAFLRKAIAAQASSVKSLEVGFFDPKQAAKAVVNEFGADDVPERPAFRNALPGAGEEAVQIIKKGVDVRTMSVDEGLARRVGEAMANRVKRSIRDLKSPPNAASTIARKGSADPLIDEGDMLDAVDYEIKK